MIYSKCLIFASSSCLKKQNNFPTHHLRGLRLFFFRSSKALFALQLHLKQVLAELGGIFRLGVGQFLVPVG